MKPEADSFALGVDIGGSKAAFALINSKGDLLQGLDTHPVPFTQSGPADPRGLIEIMEPYVRQARAIPGIFQGIGLSVCGNIDTETGEAVLVPNLHWHNLPFGQMVVDKFSLPVHAATDVRMAALAEAIWGAARGVRNFAWVTIGTGFGGYLFLDGKLYGGSHGFAGNFGHNTIDEIDGFLCGCGHKGCLETFVAGPAIARAGQAAADQGRSPLLLQMRGQENVVCPMVFQAEALGDQAARQIIAEVVRKVAIGLAGLVNTLDLEMIVLGGGVTRGSPDFVGRVDRRVRDFLMTVEARRDLRIVGETFPNSALFGAAAAVFIAKGNQPVYVA